MKIKTQKNNDHIFYMSSKIKRKLLKDYRMIISKSKDKARRDKKENI